MINWRVVVGSGAIAIVLSLLTGIISGVSFGTLVVRGLLWGVVFCGIGSGISFLISKFLPELFTAQPTGDAKIPQQRQNVDIVLPDENPHGETVMDVEKVAEEVDESALSESSSRKGNTGRNIHETPQASEDDLVEEIEEIEEFEENAVQPGTWTRDEDREEVRPPGEPGHEETPEELPELDERASDLSSSNETSDFQPRAVADISSVSGGSSPYDILGRKADSEEIAKAIRTALRKDQKG